MSDNYVDLHGEVKVEEQKLSGLIVSENPNYASNNHAILLNLNAENQHPISAITGLQEYLESLASTEDVNAFVQQLTQLVNTKVDGGYVDESGYLRLTADGEEVGDPIGPFAGTGGGGGGGGSMATYVVTLTNLLESRALTVAEDSPATVKFRYESVDDEGMDDGPGECEGL